MRWDRFVRQTLRDFRCGNKRTVVCSEHVCKDDFENAQAHRLGFAKHLRLKSKAVPSIKPDAVRVMARNSTAGVSERRSNAALKLSLSREVSALSSYGLLLQSTFYLLLFKHSLIKNKSATIGQSLHHSFDYK